jgi:hypothetical protein
MTVHLHHTVSVARNPDAAEMFSHRTLRVKVETYNAPKGNLFGHTYVRVTAAMHPVGSPAVTLNHHGNVTKSSS